MYKIKLILSLIIILVSIILCQQIISHSISNQKNKVDYAELNHIKYGLFSVDNWKKQISVVLVDEINKLYLTNTNQKKLKKHIETQLNVLINNIDQKIRESNSGTTAGWVKQAFLNIFISLEDIKKGIPKYAEAIYQEMIKSKAKTELKIIIKKKLAHYFAQTFDTQDTSKMSSILFRTDSQNIETARVKLNKFITLDNDLIAKKSLVLIILSTILFAMAAFGKQTLSISQYTPLVLSLFILLIVGVTTPMIDMEAKISEMSFVLMEHPIHFENQVLYFQSKSILDVFWIMVTDNAIQMKLVGILIIVFSIFIPLLKILSSFGYYYDYHQARENSVIKFFVLKSGKWSMADVMVVAIFMAYIGFNGIITSQFGQISSESQDLVVLTTNGTFLQPGYYLFLTYVLLALFLSEFLTRKPCYPPATKQHVASF